MKLSRCIQEGRLISRNSLLRICITILMPAQSISKDPTFVNLYTNRAMARFRIDAWEDCLDDCLKAIEMQSQNFKAYFYLAQAQLRLRHPNEALSSAITAYDIGLRTADQSTSKASELVLSAKKAKWEVRERERLRERNHLLRELEDSLLRNGDYESNQVIDPAIINEIQEATRRKIEELYSLFAISDPSNMTKREVPDYMIDQITFAFMYDPVITKSGQSYERTTIEAHLKVSATDPLTRQSLTVSELRSNLALKQACAEFLEENGWAVEW